MNKIILRIVGTELEGIEVAVFAGVRINISANGGSDNTSNPNRFSGTKIQFSPVTTVTKEMSDALYAPTSTFDYEEQEIHTKLAITGVSDTVLFELGYIISTVDTGSITSEYKYYEYRYTNK